jgi:hypothetical protein
VKDPGPAVMAITSSSSNPRALHNLFNQGQHESFTVCEPLINQAAFKHPAVLSKLAAEADFGGGINGKQKHLLKFPLKCRI